MTLRSVLHLGCRKKRHKFFQIFSVVVEKCGSGEDLYTKSSI